MIVPSFSKFMISNCVKKHNELLNDLKSHLTLMINEFSNCYLNSYDNLNDKCELFIDNGYSNLTKIKFYLSLLIIKDKNQTNKYEYEKCLQIGSSLNCNNINYTIQSMYSFINNDLEIESQNILDIAKIYGKEENTFLNSLIIKYEKNVNDQIINNHNDIITKFNKFLNNILLEIVCINEIIKNVSSSSNNW